MPPGTQTILSARQSTQKEKRISSIRRTSGAKVSSAFSIKERR